MLTRRAAPLADDLLEETFLRAWQRLLVSSAVSVACAAVSSAACSAPCQLFAAGGWHVAVAGNLFDGPKFVGYRLLTVRIRSPALPYAGVAQW